MATERPSPAQPRELLDSLVLAYQLAVERSRVAATDVCEAKKTLAVAEDAADRARVDINEARRQLEQHFWGPE